MEAQKPTYPTGLTFDDVLLLPGYSDFSRSDIDLSTQLTKKIRLTIPFVSAPMDTVTESKLAIALAKLGGIGIIHRNLTVSNQVEEVLKVKSEKMLVGAAIGSSKARPLTPEPARQSPKGLSRMADGRSDGWRGFEERVEALVKAKVDVIVIDSAHGFSKGVIETTKYVKNKFPKVEVIAGSIATYDGAEALIAAGADALRVGMGPGAICTTRIISGMGVPQITAIMEAVRAARSSLRSSGQAIPIIADGGIKHSGDMVKALAAGASTIMMGGFFSSCVESPGRSIALRREFVPKRFLNVFNNNISLAPTRKAKSNEKNNLTIIEESKNSTKREVFYFKEYRGMGSEAAMERGAKVKAEDEFHGKSYYKDKVLVAEGVEGLVPVKGTVKELLDQAIGGIKSGMCYAGARSIKELWQKAKFIQITQASLTENHPHSILITNPGKNYL